MQQRRQAIDAAARTLRQPIRKTPALRRELFAQHFRRQFGREQDAVAGDEPAALGETAMGGDEIRPRDAIAVEENDIVAARGENGAVADFGGAEAAVLVPDVLEAAADPGLPAFHQRRGRLLRAVVGHDHLEIPVGLARQRTQHRFERVFAIIGGDDDGNQHHALLALAEVAVDDKPLGRARPAMLT